MTHISTDRTNYVEIHPLNAIADQELLEFLIPGSGSFYLDVNSTLLYLRLKITKTHGTNLANDDDCGITQHQLNSIFSQMDVCLNDVLIN